MDADPDTANDGATATAAAAAVTNAAANLARSTGIANTYLIIEALYLDLLPILLSRKGMAMVAALTACAGFLLAVLWMDLIFDSQAGPGDGPLDETALSSIAGYYHRATTTSRPRGALIAAVMAALLILLGVEAVTGHRAGWLLGTSAALAGGPILLALSRTVPNAVRLGRRADSSAQQSRLARAIRRDHLLCGAGMLAFLVLWLLDALSWTN